MANSNSPSDESLNNQLVELNNRSRWYSTQLWAVPFAYFGSSLIAISGILDSAEEYLGLVFIICALLGGFVIWHMNCVRDGEKRAVDNLTKIEMQLHLNSSAEDKNYYVPFLVAVWVFVIGFAGSGIFILCQQLQCLNLTNH